jgi:hypothetical protein
LPDSGRWWQSATGQIDLTHLTRADDHLHQRLRAPARSGEVGYQGTRKGYRRSFRPVTSVANITQSLSIYGALCDEKGLLRQTFHYLQFAPRR